MLLPVALLLFVFFKGFNLRPFITIIFQAKTHNANLFRESKKEGATLGILFVL